MSANIDPIFAGTPITKALTIGSADGTTKKPFPAVGAYGGRLDQLRICSDDTSQAILQAFVSLDAGSTWSILGEIIIPAGSGTNGSALWVEGLDSLNAGNPMAMQSAEVLGLAAKNALTSGKTVTVTMRRGDF